MRLTYFDRIAGIYKHAPDFEPDETIIQLLDLSPEVHLLDVGGGAGRVAVALKNWVKWVVVADPARRMLQLARAKALPVVCTPAENLPFPDGSYERVVMLDALHHVGDQIATASELWRILAPGGRILIIDPDLDHFSARLLSWMEKVLFMHSHFLSARGIVGLFDYPDAQIAISPSDKYAIVLIEKVRQM
jgi:ubiquinone/menaquinone biosynthesis C-methylase UbiE